MCKGVNVLRECRIFLLIGSRELNKVLNIFFIFTDFKKKCRVTNAKKKGFQCSVITAQTLTVQDVFNWKYIHV